jgi:hypothetical protein
MSVRAVATSLSGAALLCGASAAQADSDPGTFYNTGGNTPTGFVICK